MSKCEPRSRFWLWFWIVMAYIGGLSDGTARRYAREAQQDVDRLAAEVADLRQQIEQPEPPK